MTPEQLEDIREWAEWGDTTPSHMVHALLDHIDDLTARLAAVRELVAEFEAEDIMPVGQVALIRAAINGDQ